MTTPKILQTIQDDIANLGWVPPGGAEFQVFVPDDDDVAWHLYAFPRVKEGDDGVTPFFLELTLITDRLTQVTSIVFDTGTEPGEPPSVRIRGVVGKMAVMICVLHCPGRQHHEKRMDEGQGRTGTGKERQEGCCVEWFARCW